MITTDHTSAKPPRGRPAADRGSRSGQDVPAGRPSPERAQPDASAAARSSGSSARTGQGKSTTVKILTTLTPTGFGRRRVAGHDVLRHPDRVRRSIGAVGQRSAVDPHATGRENLVLQGRVYGLGGRELRDRVAEPARAVRPHRGRRPDRRDVVGRHAAQARRRDGPRPPPGRALPRRADNRPRSRGPGRAVGRDRGASRPTGSPILLTTHYLEEADRLAGRLAIVDRRSDRRHGTPEALKAELRGDAIHVELESAAAGPQAAGGPRPARRPRPADRRRHDHLGPSRPGGLGRPVRPRRARRGRRRGRLGDRRPTVARRRLPPPYRPDLSARCGVHRRLVEASR